MKRQILIALLVLVSYCTNGQTSVKRDSLGNFYAAKSAVKTSENKKTEYTFTDSKGNKHPVYESVNGKYFIIRTSAKTGNQYKQYLK